MNRVVVFDLDDTLFPEWQFVLSGFAAVDEWLQTTHKISGFESFARELFQAGSRGNIFDLALAKLGREPKKSLIQQMLRIYREHPPKIQLYEDAAWAINYFRARGPLGLLSDGYLVTQQNKFAALNIAEAFEAVVFSDALGRECWKPSPEPYRRIMQAIAGEPSEFVYVADNPAKDFVTARNLGWSTIHIDRPEGVYHNRPVTPGYEADVRIETLFALEKL
jgi:putative hydrolase of the HAD superfamily